MAQKVPVSYPITNVCVVSDPQKCPPSYDLLMKSKDREGDCDLWKESNVFKRVTRYLCFTRSFEKASPENKVLVAMQVTNERELPPRDFYAIDKTIDTEEKAFRKKQICIKMMDRNSASDAISDIVLLTKSKRPLEGYMLVGEINGILVCVKMCKVPPETQMFSHSSAAPTVAGNNQHSNGPSRPAPAPPIASYQAKPNGGLDPRLNQSAILPGKPDVSVLTPLSNVDFQINPTITADSKKSSLGKAPSFSFRSLNDIENEYHYPFTLERSVLQKASP